MVWTVTLIDSNNQIIRREVMNDKLIAKTLYMFIIQTHELLLKKSDE